MSKSSATAGRDGTPAAHAARAALRRFISCGGEAVGLTRTGTGCVC